MAAGRDTAYTHGVERDRIQQAALGLYGRTLPIPYRNVVNIQPAQTCGRRITATIEGLFALGAYPEPGKPVQALVRRLEEQLIYELAYAVNSLQYAECSREARHAARRLGLMRRAEEYLQANLYEPFSLVDFAEAVGISHRMLQHHFRRIYGVTPQVWFRCMKLNAIRRELKQSKSTGERISDIALRWGFLHFGRFSDEYRRLFDERPKDTIAR